MTTILIPGELIASTSKTPEGLAIELETAPWTEEQADAFQELRKAHGLTDAESDELTDELDTILIKRALTNIIRKRTR